MVGGKGGDMTQTLYAHMNKIKIKKKKRSDNFSRIPYRTRTEKMINQATFCLGLFDYAHLSPPATILPLLNLKLMSVPRRWAEVFILPVPEVCPCCIISLLSLPFTTTHLFIWCIGVSGWT
jgi:hypothetical protein